MTKRTQSGFSIVETILVLVILAAVALAGYVVYGNRNQYKAPSTAANTPSYQSPSTTVPSAPQIKTAADLNKAMAALNQTNLAAANTDSAQLSSQSSGL